MNARDRLILALDVDTLDDARRLAGQLNQYVGLFKVGLQLFCSEGPRVFQELHAEGASIFFDCKFHDIPNTVAQASKVASSHGVYMFNVHASGGAKMMSAAAEAARAAAPAGKPAPKVIAVTVLTSMGQQTLSDELGVGRPLTQQVTELARLTQRAGLDGVVASAVELKDLRAACGPDFLLVTPGVRPSWAGADDQVRIVTPAQAIADGADYIVVGRPITAADRPVEAAKRIVDEIEESLAAV